MKKKIISIAVGVVVVLSIGFFALWRNVPYVRDVDLHGINLTYIADGSYTGTFERGRFSNTLTVQVEDNRIVGIDMADDVFGARMTDISEEVFDRVIEAQNTDIDTVTGATITTNAYLKAIENALSE